MYTPVLILHSWLRWATIAAGVMAIVAALKNPVEAGREGSADRWGLAFMMAMDVQLLVGLSLYLALSPITAAILNDFGSAMRDPSARFWAVEHVSMMLFAVVMAHVGRVLGRTARTATAKRTRLMICFIAAVIAVLAATPWPGLRSGRPLFRISTQAGEDRPDQKEGVFNA